MALKILLNIFQTNFSSWWIQILLNIFQQNFSSSWNVWLSHLMLPVKLALKNKMNNTIKLETQDQRVHQSTQRFQLFSANYHCSLHCRWMSYKLLMSYVCSNWGVCLLGKESHVLYGCREWHKLQSLIKTTSSR